MSDRDNRVSPLAWAGYGLLFALILWRIGALLYRALGDLAFPYELDYGEGMVLNQALLIATGHNPYAPLDRYPVLLANYPPVFPALCALGARWLGPTFLVGRLITLLAAFGTAALIGAIVRRITRAALPALIAAGVFLTLFAVQAWASLMRVDMLALFFAVAGLACLVRGGRAQWASILLFTLALFTKPNMLAAPLAGYAYLFLHDRRRALTLSLGWVALTAVAVAVFHFATHGWFLVHTLAANVSPLDLRNSAAGFGLLFNLHAAVIALALAGLAASGWPRERLLFLGYAALAALVFVSVGKRGSNVNYTLELLAALSVPAGVGLALADRLRRAAAPGAALGIGLMLLLAIELGATGTSRSISRSPDARAVRDRVVSILRYTPGPVLSEDLSLLEAARKPVVFEPFGFTQMVAAGRLNQAPIVRAVAEGRFSLIILTFDPTAPGARPDEYGNWDERFGRWSGAIIDAMVQRYQHVDTIGPYTLWAPREPAP